MSRLLDALKNLQHAEEPSEEAPPRKVTPRLTASLRKVVPPAPPAKVTPRRAPNVLFSVPATAPAPQPPTPAISAAASSELVPVASEPASAPVEPAPTPIEVAPVVAAAITAAPPIPAPDPVKLIEVIQASISSMQQEIAQVTAAVEPTPAPLPVPEAPPQPSRPTPTAAEAELRGLLASAAHAQPYQEMLAMVQRNLTGKPAPTIAIVGLDGQDSTEHVAAALGTLLADQANQAEPTLLIEANPQRSLARRYGALQSTGLMELLAGRVERSAAVRPTSHERLDVIPFGLATQEQARLLPSALSSALQHVRGKSVAAVIDAGPLSCPWALPASQAAHAVYLVVRVGDTSAEFATGCVERFRAAGGKLTGCIAVGPLPA